MFQSFRSVKAYKVPPRNRNEFLEYGQSWPVVFRPNEESEARSRGIVGEELTQVLECIEKLKHDEYIISNIFSNNEGSAILVNPENNKVKF